MAAILFVAAAATVGPAGWSVDELERIFQQEGTDKQSREPGHSYVQTYASTLGPWRHALRAMVEIGIGTLSGKFSANMRYWWWAMQNHGHVGKAKAGVRPRDVAYQPGASLRSWRRYFPHARVIGLDVDADAVGRARQTEGVEAYVANASSAASLAAVLPADLALDLIIDDGDHRWAAQQATLLHMWRYLRPGGYYFIEDVSPDDFSNASLRSPAAHALLMRAGAALISPAAARVRGGVRSGPIRAEQDGLLLLRRPAEEAPVRELSRTPASSNTTD